MSSILPNSPGGNTLRSMPRQMIPKKKKTAKWLQHTIDSLEAIGYRQFMDNLRFIENYEMVRGKFIYHHYFEMDGYKDMLSALIEEFEIPKYLRHYDIISPVINVLVNEYMERPDGFAARAIDADSSDKFIREKTKMLMEYVDQEINAEIEANLIAEGLVPEEEYEAEDEEQAQQYSQQREQRKQALKPEEIERYMRMNWKHVAEMWATDQIKADKHRFNTSEMDMKELEDMLISDRCFRHFYLRGLSDYGMETWNPIFTFFHKSPEIEYVEHGDYVGRFLFLTQPEVINRYGTYLREDELNQLDPGLLMDDDNINSDDVDPYGIPRGAVVPFNDYPDYKMMRDVAGAPVARPMPEGIESIADIEDLLGNQIGASTFTLQTKGLIQCVEVYWISQRKIGKVTFQDPESGMMMKTLVDEDFIVPPNFVEIDYGTMVDDTEPNTVMWTWVNELWGGIKINTSNTRLEKPLFINAKRQDFQFKGDENMYGVKLPVCGQVFTNRNSQSQSLVDLMKADQIGHNVAMNQLYQIMEKEVGRFVLMDSRFLVNQKGWGGEEAANKFISVAKSLGVGLVDGSPSNTGGSTFSHFQDINLDESARMMNRAKLAEFFETLAKKRVGITDQRLGQVLASETATGTKQAVNQSYAQTESYFTKFSNYKRRCIQMNLDIAQFVQSQQEIVTVASSHSDVERSFIRINGTDLLLPQLGVFVTNSQEDLRKIETIRQLVMNNPNLLADPLDLTEMLTTNSVAVIKSYLKKAKADREAQEGQQREHEQQLEQSRREGQAEITQADSENKQLDRESREKIAYINTFKHQEDNLKDSMDDGDTPDVLEYDKHNLDVQTRQDEKSFRQQELDIKREDQQLKSQQSSRDAGFRNRELDLKKEDIEAKKFIAVKNKNKYDAKRPAKKPKKK